ncbi:MAG TPA: hypothetical protein VLS90_04820, partial [Thermodesulfobacteriota bacterium]|nr:hypothetical protein [Thermodesulfobacteriota bacterium]
MDNKDLMALLEKMGLPFKSVQTTLEEADVEKVKHQINLARKDSVVEKRVKPTVIRRRAVVPQETAAPAPPAPAPPQAKPPAARPPQAPPAPRKEIRPEVPPQPAPEGGEAPMPEAATAAEVQAPAPPVAPPAAVSPGAPAVHEEERRPEIPAEPQSAPAAAAAQQGAAVPEARKPAPEPGEPRPKPPERGPKPKRKSEPAKIIERPAVPPAFLIKEREPAPERKIVPGGAPRPPIILQRPTPGSAPGGARPAPAATPTDDSKARRKKRVKRDVEVMEEGKPNRVRVITTKKRSFKDSDYRDDRAGRAFVSEEDDGRPRVAGRSQVGKTEITTPKAIKRK